VIEEHYLCKISLQIYDKFLLEFLQNFISEEAEEIIEIEQEKERIK